MFGRTDAFTYFVTAVSLVAATTDLVKGRIYNCLTLPAILIGIIGSATWGGWVGLSHSLLGILMGLLLYGWMFLLGIMGGGDVKFLMALGALGGIRFVFQVGILGVLLGGVMAFAILVLSGRIVDFGVRLYRFLLVLFVKELEFAPPQINRKLKMPFGVPIAAAALWVLYANPFEKWGWRLWF